MAVIVTLLYAAVMGVICIYGGHRYWLLWLYARRVRRSGRAGARQARRFGELPSVCVQLPMYNERNVAERVIEAACRLEYPQDRLRIQVLDDSTDASAEIARTCCERMRGRGHAIESIHRADRTGFKAGALANGMKRDHSEFIAIFDADFLPPADFLLRTVPAFADESVGMVQAEWDHLNRHESILTECQAMFLDGHFVIEQTVRAASGRWFNFNGTAGVWRRRCIEEAGGWEHDTLTEDADLSYRAQVKGWTFVYLPDVKVPAELPPTTSAFLSQQHRWNKGLIQTAIKLMPAILRSDAPWKVKLEAWFHLTTPIVYVAIVLLMVLAPLAYLFLPYTADWDWPTGLIAGVIMLTFGTFAAGAFYLAAQMALGFRAWESMLYLPILMAIGIGISVINTKAVLEAVLGIQSPFVRTPKFNKEREGEPDPAARRTRRLIPTGTFELLLAGLAIACFVLSFREPFNLIATPFLLLFACGYLSIGIPAFAREVAARRG